MSGPASRGKKFASRPATHDRTSGCRLLTQRWQSCNVHNRLMGIFLFSYTGLYGRRPTFKGRFGYFGQQAVVLVIQGEDPELNHLGRDELEKLGEGFLLDLAGGGIEDVVLL